MSSSHATETTHDGGCQCGAVRFRTSNTPIRAMACHCTACKRRTGAAYGIGVYFNEQEVEFLQGEMGRFQFESDISGRWLQNEYCLNCGATLTWTLEMRPGLRAIAGGNFDNPNWYTVEAHIWTRSARDDMCYPNGMPVHSEVLKTP